MKDLFASPAGRQTKWKVSGSDRKWSRRRTAVDGKEGREKKIKRRSVFSEVQRRPVWGSWLFSVTVFPGTDCLPSASKPERKAECFSSRKQKAVSVKWTKPQRWWDGEEGCGGRGSCDAATSYSERARYPFKQTRPACSPTDGSSQNSIFRALVHLQPPCRVHMEGKWHRLSVRAVTAELEGNVALRSFKRWANGLRRQRFVISLCFRSPETLTSIWWSVMGQDAK